VIKDGLDVKRVGISKAWNKQKRQLLKKFKLLAPEYFNQDLSNKTTLADSKMMTESL
jgi:hypothetical protein